MDPEIPDSVELHISNNNQSFDSYFWSPILLISNTTASLYEVTINQIPIGVYNHSIIAYYSELPVFRKLYATTPENIEYFINYECSIIPDSLELKSYSPRGLELDVFGDISAYFRFENVKSQVHRINSNCFECFLFGLPNNYNKIIFLMTELNLGYNYTPYISIHPNGGEKEVFFRPEPYFNLSVTDNIIEAQRYPALGYDVLAKLSVGYGPLFSFKSINNQYTLPFYFQYSDEGILSSDFYYRPISSKDGVTKYIGNIDYLYETNYNIGAQDGPGYKYILNSLIHVEDKSFNDMGDKYNFTQEISKDNYFTVSFFLTQTSILGPFNIEYYNTYESTFPFGHSLSDKRGIVKFSFFTEPISYQEGKFIVSGYNGTKFTEGFKIEVESIEYDLSAPTFEDIEFIHLFDHNYILRIKLKSKYEIFKLLIDEKYYYPVGLLNGTLEEPTFDFHVDLFNPITEILAYHSRELILMEPYYYSINPLKYFSNPKFIDDDFDIFNITFSKMLYYEIDVTNRTVGNILYFNYTNINIETPIALVLFDPVNKFASSKLNFNDYPTDKLWYSRWNSSLELFQIEFYVNSLPGKIPYGLFFDCNNYVPSNSLSNDSQLRVISKNLDLYGPIFENLSKFPLEPPLDIGFNNFKQKQELEENEYSLGYTFNIIDEYNGFKEGYITLRNIDDGSLYNFTLTPKDAISGTKYNGSYAIKVKLSTENCVGAQFDLIEVKLFDEQGFNSTFSRITFSGGTSSANGLSNPFINYLNNPYLLSVYFFCPTPIEDLSNPNLLLFEIVNAPNETNPIDVGSHNRFLEFKVIAQDKDSGLKKGQFPIIYVATTNLNIYECKNITSIDEIDQFTAQFNYKCQLPIGYGYPFGMVFQLYTITNNGGLYSGFTTDDLNKAGFKYKIDRTEIIMSLNYPSIAGTNRILKQDKEIWIYGRGFSKVDQVSLVLPNKTKVKVEIDKNFKSALKLRNLPNGLSRFFIEFTFQENSSTQVYQDDYEIIIGNDIDNTPDYEINPDQVCEGKPKCGGPSNGYCSSTGCVCYSPWIGKDCLSQTIIIPDIDIDVNEPMANISHNDKNVIYKSIVSIVSLREIDITGKIVFEKKFDKWNYTKLSNESHLYQNDISDNSNIKAKLVWYENESNVTFANQIIHMNPSTIKYTIDIDKYQFKSRLNSLELIMSASFESSKTNDICSSSDFGNTTNGDNSI
ncbi:hypothetical protein DICPUDRAFT_79781 [Dictyostelium purpureum]|uniref:EGF-like domain-containing protein n=1 Tax=Dictyostelium purpureum TaxID=5786 RepID=F0ZNL5_DICPU|nr:uncharacterized protein DICPUDRAFT_79781 [Dictyostelium purpureum]EGC34465.1 hypothetical protein DICPUDRAFT_79781 [Dictyostelium purpureum]|eukprot:XP_003289000.1 hypothetical protein DICPUDRAFT_79781 [Dictyostelium purpureum]